VGLYRTEFVYLNRNGLPTEEDHYRFYAKVAQSVLPHPVILRTLDIGGDKLVDLGFPELNKSEPNPFLGLRGIRLALRHPDLFRTQIRAILRASAHGKVRVMFPMVSGLEEFRAARKMVNECMDELRKENDSLRRKNRSGA
jgi:phosphotransferase system enzyme I (PtsI)